jgi:hypothetical protein
MTTGLPDKVMALLRGTDGNADKNLHILRQLPSTVTDSSSLITVITLILKQCYHSSPIEEMQYWKVFLRFIGTDLVGKTENVSSIFKSNAIAILRHEPLLNKLAIVASRGRNQSLFWGTEVIYRLSFYGKLSLPSSNIHWNEDMDPLEANLPCYINKRILDFLNDLDLQMLGRCSRHCAKACRAQLAVASVRDLEEYQMITYSVSTATLEAYLSTHLESRQATEQRIHRAGITNAVRELDETKYHLNVLTSRAIVAASRQQGTVQKYALRLKNMRTLTIDLDRVDIEANVSATEYLFLEACRVMATIQYQFVEWSQELLSRVDTLIDNND